MYGHRSFQFVQLMGLDKRGQPKVNYGLETKTEFQFQFAFQVWLFDCISLADYRLRTQYLKILLPKFCSLCVSYSLSSMFLFSVFARQQSTFLYTYKV